MNKMMKNLLLAFTLVCIIVLVVFSIELIVINRNTDDKQDSGSPVSGNKSGGEEKSAENENLPPDASNPPRGSGSEPSANTTQQHQGKAYSLLDSIVLYADEELFEYEALSDRYVFAYKSEETARLEIRSISIPRGASKHAETYIDSYLDGNESFVGGTGQIKRSPLSGVYVSGVNDGETVEAWIYTTPDDPDNDFTNMGIAFVVCYRNDEQKNALYTILDTLALA